MQKKCQPRQQLGEKNVYETCQLVAPHVALRFSFSWIPRKYTHRDTQVPAKGDHLFFSNPPGSFPCLAFLLSVEREREGEGEREMEWGWWWKGVGGLEGPFASGGAGFSSDKSPERHRRGAEGVEVWEGKVILSQSGCMPVCVGGG